MTIRNFNNDNNKRAHSLDNCKPFYINGQDGLLATNVYIAHFGGIRSMVDMDGHPYLEFIFMPSFVVDKHKLWFTDQYETRLPLTKVGTMEPVIKLPSSIIEEVEKIDISINTDWHFYGVLKNEKR